MWRRKGDGKERCHVAVEEEGERELLSDPQHAEEVPRERESFSQTLNTRKKFPESERDVAKRRKNEEERRTNRLFFLYDCPRPLLPPHNDRVC